MKRFEIKTDEAKKLKAHRVAFKIKNMHQHYADYHVVKTHIDLGNHELLSQLKKGCNLPK